jgi:hypothetical protein
MARAKHTHADAGAATRSGGDARRHARRSGMWAAHLELGHEQRVGCIVLDLSAGGAKLQLEQPLAIGQIVTLIADSVGARGARIVWIDGDRAGVEFIAVSAEIVDLGALHRRDFAATPVHAPAPKSAGLDAQFLRGRAAVLRRLAETNPAPDKAAALLRSAQAMETEAAELDEQHRLSSKREF